MKRLEVPRIHDERGVVSITVAVVFILIITLVVLGFSQVTRRNEKQAIDRHLNSQAYYAAETGVNDAMNKIAKDLEEGKKPADQTVCKKDVLAGGYTRNGGNIDEADGTLYSCLLVDTSPPALTWDHVDDTSIVTPISAGDRDGDGDSSNDELGDYTIEWHRTAGKTAGNTDIPTDRPVSNCTAQPHNLPNSTAWNKQLWDGSAPKKGCPFGLLRVDLTRISSNTITNATAASKATMTLFLYPRSGDVDNPPTIPFTYAGAGISDNIYGEGVRQQGVAKAAACNNELCRIKIIDLGFPDAYVKLRSIYVDSKNVQLQNPNGTENSQILVDVTGKAQDVLRRMQVYVPIAGSSRTDRNTYSDFGLQTGKSICKRYVVSPEYPISTPDDRSGCTN